MPTKGLSERLQDGEYVVVAEGYVFEFERRGYLKAGAFVPEVVIEHPDLVKALYEEFVHAGSDVVLAFTYYGHRAKLKLIGREHDLEKMNRLALRMAREVADCSGTLMAGNICNTTLWKPDNKEAQEHVRQIFKEQIEWAVQEKADFIVAETFHDFGEAKMALECIKEFGKGLPSVITLMPIPGGKTYDGVDHIEGLQILKDTGADVVGFNCCFGLQSMLTLMEKAASKVKGPLACLPVPYRTDEERPAMQSFRDPVTGNLCFPEDLDMWLCARSHVADFSRGLKKLGVQYMGLCCGNRAHFTRTMAETLGRSPPASKYSPDMTQHLSRTNDEEHGHTFTSWQDIFEPERKHIAS